MAFTPHEHREFNEKRKNHLAANPICAVNKALGNPDTPATRILHKKGRKKYYLDTSTYLSVSKWGDSWVHANRTKARELGLIDI